MEHEAVLKRDEYGLFLTDGVRTLRVDLRDMMPRLKQSNLEREMLLKAARIRNAEGPFTAVDATAGLGADSLLLAAGGFRVILFEKDPVIAALLRDALERAAEDPDLASVVFRMELREEDSIAAMKAMADRPDVILLDPMFPERTKSAAVKKKFQLIHQLECPCEEEEELLGAAISARPRKLVIKRPLKGAWLAGRRPDYSLEGKAIRYDCFTFAREQ